MFNKEAVTIILWYATCIFVKISVSQSVPDNYLGSNSVIVLVLTYSSIIALYSFLGLFADVLNRKIQTDTV